MSPLSRWILRAGSAVAVLSFFLPCLEISASGTPIRFSPFSFCKAPGLSAGAEGVFAFDAAAYVAPLLAGALLLAGTWIPKRARRILSVLLLILSVAWAFGLATEGSLLHTAASDPESLRVPRALALALFVGPVVIGAGVTSQILRGAPPAATDRVVRTSLGLLMLLYGFYRQAGWGCSAGWGRLLAYLLPLAGLLVAASSALDSRARLPLPAAPADGA